MRTARIFGGDRVLRKEPSMEDRDDLDARHPDNTLDLYNDELARKAVGSLFEEEELPADEAYPVPEKGRYVTGFDKPPAKTRARAVEEPRADDVDEEDEEEYTYRKRERKESTPAPRPAVKVNVAAVPSSQRTAGHSHARPRPVPSRSEPVDLPEDDYASFRPRDKSRASSPAPALRQTDAPVSRRPAEKRYSDYDDPESTNPVRWVAAALTFVFLVILALLVYRITVVSGQLKDAQTRLESMPSNESEITEMRLTIERLENEVEAKNTEIEQLQAGLTGSQPVTNPVITPETSGNVTEQNNSPATQSPTVNASGLPTVYTVVSGDNLTKISQKFYGNTSLDNIQKIKDANNLTNDNISIGQELKIPE